MDRKRQRVLLAAVASRHPLDEHREPKPPVVQCVRQWHGERLLLLRRAWLSRHLL